MKLIPLSRAGFNAKVAKALRETADAAERMDQEIVGWALAAVTAHGRASSDFGYRDQLGLVALVGVIENCKQDVLDTLREPEQ